MNFIRVVAKVLKNFKRRIEKCGQYLETVTLPK